MAKMKLIKKKKKKEKKRKKNPTSFKELDLGSKDIEFERANSMTENFNW